MASTKVVRRTSKVLFVVCTVVLAVAGTSARSQQATRNLAGSITDPHHEPLKGAVVQLHNDTTKSVISYITGRDGLYRFERLDANTDYHVSADYKGHPSPSKGVSLYDTAPNKVVDLVIPLD